MCFRAVIIQRNNTRLCFILTLFDTSNASAATHPETERENNINVMSQEVNLHVPSHPIPAPIRIPPPCSPPISCSQETRARLRCHGDTMWPILRSPPWQLLPGYGCDWWVVLWKDVSGAPGSLLPWASALCSILTLWWWYSGRRENQWWGRMRAREREREGVTYSSLTVKWSVFLSVWTSGPVMRSCHISFLLVYTTALHLTGDCLKKLRFEKQLAIERESDILPIK